MSNPYDTSRTAAPAEPTAPPEPGKARPPVSPAVYAMLTVVAFVVLSFMWRLLVECSGGLITVALFAATGQAIDPNEPMAMFRADVTAVGTIISLGGMAAIAAAMAWAAERDPARAFALTQPAAVAVVAALLGGCVVGFFPGFIAELLQGLLPSWAQLGATDLIREALLDSPLYAKALMALAICIAAPLFEELVFRGYLWDATEQGTNWVFAWLLTSFLFAAYHIDPVQGTAVLWTGLFLGWLRHVSGSVWPAIAAHFANNALATVLTFTVEVNDVESVPWWAVGISIAGTLAAGGVAWAVRRPRAVEDEGG